jgi:hypothetical protein
MSRRQLDNYGADLEIGETLEIDIAGITVYVTLEMVGEEKVLKVHPEYCTDVWIPLKD